MNLEFVRDHWKARPVKLEDAIAAWDSSAEEYLFEDNKNFEEDSFLRFMAEKCDLTKEMSSLDVGCGAGAYSVAMAKHIAQVDGVDFSPRMIEVGNNWVKSHGVENVRLWVLDWHSCSGEEFRKKYDVVFAHTTPAVADYTSLVKMCEASKESCFLCTPSRRSDEVFDELCQIAGLPEMRHYDDSVAYTFDTLWGLGYNPEVSYEKTVWKSGRKLEDAEVWYLGRLRGSHDLSAETENALREALVLMARDGVIHERIETTLVNMFWRVDG